MNKTRCTILNYAETHTHFKFSDLLGYLHGLEPITKVNLSWHLRVLVKENSLFKLGRGLYTLQKQKSALYLPSVRRKGIKLYKEISSAFPYIKVSVLDGQAFAEFQHHLSINNAIYIEVDRDLVEAVFHHLKKSHRRVYMNPTKDFVYDYIDLTDNVIIVKPMITESPLIDCNSVRTSSLEKILVDIYCDEDLDYLHGSEWYYILRNALSLYWINRSSMFRYASRRNAKTKIQKDLNKLLGIILD